MLKTGQSLSMQDNNRNSTYGMINSYCYYSLSLNHYVPHLLKQYDQIKNISPFNLSLSTSNDKDNDNDNDNKN